MIALTDSAFKFVLVLLLAGFVACLAWGLWQALTGDDE